MYYETIAEYYEAHKKDKHNFGDGELPTIRYKTKNTAMRTRRGIKIHAYVGPNGGGKSLAMINDTIPTMNGDTWVCNNHDHFHYKAYGQTTGLRKILSTVRLVDPRTGKDHPLYIRFHDFRQLLSAEHCDILMDEIVGVASAYEGMSMPTQVNNILMQLRRRDVTLRWTTPNWSSAAKRIREVSKAVTYCVGRFAVYADGASWPSNSLFEWKTYDAGNFEQFTVGTRNNAVPITFEWYARIFKKNKADALYDTLSEVTSIGSHTANGMCVHCGGKRSIKGCTCDRDAVDTEEHFHEIGAELGLNEYFEKELAEGEKGADAPSPPADLPEAAFDDVA